MAELYPSIANGLGYSVLGLGVVFLMLVILMAIITVMGKVVASKEKPAANPIPAPAATKAVEPTPVKPLLPPAPGSAGSIDLHGVEPRKAAMIMAIVADEMGVPVNELRFKSIKEL
ncbi:MAG: hypothetical protein E7423_10325 [Ruminococcaceae bacterium]|jgi:sodium pump decarboxylase gamma subunit|nr:hypothetical protein [Oscillospiraceae bacterium]